MAKPRKPRTPRGGAQPPAGFGHNGGPDMTAERVLEILGPKPETAIELFECGAPWTAYADDVELKRLGKVHRRIVMRELALAELRAERTKIMRRCIRRMRRAEGKD